MKTIEELVKELNALTDLAGSEQRSLTPDELVTFEELERQILASQKTEELRARAAAYAAPNASLSAAVNVSTTKRDNTLDEAFEALVRSGHGNADVAELRAQGSTGSAGGYLVPETFLKKITERLKAFGGVAEAAETINTASGEAIRWPTLDDTANSGVIQAEGTAPSSGGADLVFGEKTLGAFTYTAPGAGQLPLRVSQELLQDSAIDVEALVFRKLAERIARKQARDFVNGAGTTEPFGIATGTAVDVNTFDAATPTYADLLKVVRQVDPDYRDGAVWTFNDYTMGLIEGLVDANGRPLLNNAADGINVGRSNQYLLGYPVVIDQAWANYADAGTNKWGAFGNLSRGYLIRRIEGAILIPNPYTRASEGQIEYTLRMRADATVQDPYAFRVLQNEVS